MNTLIGNIGGYIGLLMGVSITQIPDIMLQMYRSCKDFYKNSKKSSLKNKDRGKEEFSTMEVKTFSSSSRKAKFVTIDEKH